MKFELFYNLLYIGPMFSYQILNHPVHFSLDESRITEIFQLISDEVDVPQNGILNIAFLSDEEIQKLNQHHRGIDKNTDVLSFHYFEDFSDISTQETSGECIFSESKILSQSEEYHHLPREEFEILLIHSLLHIIGYDHEEDEDFQAMWSYEEPIRRKM